MFKPLLNYSFLSLLAISLCALGAHAAEFQVQVRNFSFSPATLDIKTGDTVTWINIQGTHNVFANNNGGFSSGDARSDNWTFSHTFNTAGNFTYVCQPHAPGMAGAIRVTAANTPPTVSITQPGNGATFLTTQTITINANAADAGGSITRVEFFNGATSLGIDTATPYSVAVTLSAGQHTLTAKATDNSNTTTTSAAVNITVNPPANLPPAVSITQPANGAAFLTSQSITISANAGDTDGSVSKVEFFDGATLLGMDDSEPYSISVTLGAGPHSITAIATDNQNSSATSAASAITVNSPQNASPTISISQPANNTIIEEGAALLLAATASDPDGSVSKVEFFNGETSIGIANGSFQFNWSTPAAGKLTVTAVATDNSGAATTSQPITIQVAARPMLAITRNTDGTMKITTVGTLGLNHTLQSKTDLKAATWTDVTTALPGRGGALTFDNLPVEAAPKFYRVVMR